MAKKISIYDVAKEAGVSAAAVSYVINGKGKVSEKTRKRIVRIMDEMGYVPDSAAISLSTGKTMLVGLCLPLDEASRFAENPFYSEFIASFEQTVSPAGYDVVLGSIKDPKAFAPWIRSRSFDALVLFDLYDEEVYRIIKKARIPAVLVDAYNERADEFSNVRVNDQLGSFRATEYLISLGHRHIGFMGARLSKSLLDQKRFKGYCKALEHHSLPLDESIVFDTATSFDGGYSLGEEVGKKIGEMTAIVCDADIIAIGLMRRLMELGYSVPKDLSIIGFDDITSCTFVYPPLSTVKQGIARKGEEAGKLILNLVKNALPDNETIILEPELVCRGTVLDLREM